MFFADRLEHIIATRSAPYGINGFGAVVGKKLNTFARLPRTAHRQVTQPSQRIERTECRHADGSGRLQPLGHTGCCGTGNFGDLSGRCCPRGHEAKEVQAEIEDAFADIARTKILDRRAKRHQIEQELLNDLGPVLIVVGSGLAACLLLDGIVIKIDVFDERFRDEPNAG